MSANGTTIKSKLFGYTERFQVDWLPVTPEAIPPDILPRRLESRS